MKEREIEAAMCRKIIETEVKCVTSASNRKGK